MKLRDQKKIKVDVKVDIESTLGRLSREEYLKINPHGYSSKNKVHKNKKKYNRKHNK